jgi:V/A-type H+-transporting ATPase subunit F
MSIRVIGSAETFTAFALAGVEGRIVENRAEMLSALDELARLDDVKVLAVEEASADLARGEIDRLKLDAGAPLVVEVPGIHGPTGHRQTALDLVRQALGIRL